MCPSLDGGPHRRGQKWPCAQGWPADVRGEGEGRQQRDAKAASSSHLTPAGPPDAGRGLRASKDGDRKAPEGQQHDLRRSAKAVLLGRQTNYRGSRPCPCTLFSSDSSVISVPGEAHKVAGSALWRLPPKAEAEQQEAGHLSRPPAWEPAHRPSRVRPSTGPREGKRLWQLPEATHHHLDLLLPSSSLTSCLGFC